MSLWPFTRNRLSAVHSHTYPAVVRNNPSLTPRSRSSSAPMTLLR